MLNWKVNEFNSTEIIMKPATNYARTAQTNAMCIVYSLLTTQRILCVPPWPATIFVYYNILFVCNAMQNNKLQISESKWK